VIGKDVEVMMIGDGLNDVLSLKEAGVGVSINAKSELNLMAADVIILNENLWKIPILFKLMNLANRVVHINLVWAFAYNVVMARIIVSLC
jgi:Cu+-exporting ATPase